MEVSFPDSYQLKGCLGELGIGDKNQEKKCRKNMGRFHLPNRM